MQLNLKHSFDLTENDRMSRKRRLRYSSIFVTALLFPLLANSESAFNKKRNLNQNSKRIFVLDTASLESSSDYTVGNELLEIKIGTEEGIKRAKVLYPKCDLSIDSNSMIKIETQGEFQQRIMQIKNKDLANAGPVILIGFSRSSNANTVAEILKGTSIVGISVGAAAPLSNLNKNFYSVAYKIDSQWKRIGRLFKELQCTNVYGYFPLTNSYSSSLSRLFAESKFGTNISNETSMLNKKYAANDCLYIGGNYSDVVNPLHKLIKYSKVSKIIGPADWALSAGEINNLMKFTQRDIVIYAPSGWPQNGYELNSKAKKLKISALKNNISDPSPVLAYSYDASLLSASSLCADKSISHLVKSKSLNKEFIRKYSGIMQSGNLVGEFFIHKFQSKHLRQ